MMLLTKAIRAAFPKLRETEKQGKDAKIMAKFFVPWGRGTWYATEFDGEDTFFGYVDLGMDNELGYFSLAELQGLRGPAGLTVERDRYFDHSLREVMEKKVR